MANKTWKLNDTIVVGGQDKPDDIPKMNKRLAEQELLVFEMHKEIRALKEEIKEQSIKESSLVRSAKIKDEIMNEVWLELNTSKGNVTLNSYRKLEEIYG